MAKTGTLQTDQLFKGLTRPPVIFGVSYSFFGVNFLVTILAYVLTKNASVLLFFGPIVHAIGFVISAKEPLFIELFMVRAQKCNNCRNKFFHGSNSYDVM